MNAMAFTYRLTLHISMQATHTETILSESVKGHVESSFDHCVINLSRGEICCKM